MRQHAARGTIINAVFLISLSGLGLIRGFVLARFLSRSDYGIWGILVAALGTLLFLKTVGVGDKYVQQEEEDQELAFQRAFTVEAIITGAFILLMLAAVPVVALAYGRWELLAPGFVLVLLVPAGALQAPLWIFWRQMNYVRQRLLQLAEPVLGFVIAVVLAVLGAGYWALLVAAVSGAWVGALMAIRWSPYRLRFRYERATLRSYLSFSWPLFVVGVSGLLSVQASAFFSTEHLGLAAAGAIALAATISQFAERVDKIVSDTLYPAICAVQDRIDLLYETFIKANSLALMWAVPFGVGLTLFSADLVRFGIGHRWQPALPLLQAFGLLAAMNQLAFNWDNYFRARGETRPMAVVQATTAVVFLATSIPLLYLDGLEGFAIGVGMQGVTHLAGRLFYVRRLFPNFRMLPHAMRAIAPTLPAAALVLALRAIAGGGHGLGWSLAQLALFVAVVAVATGYIQRDLLREVVGYLSRRRQSDIALA
jgi:PST family polysaccharide transporter